MRSPTLLTQQELPPFVGNLPPEMQGQLKTPPAHGKLVEHVLRKTDTRLDESLIRRIDNFSSSVSEPKEFDKRIEDAALNALDASTAALQSVLDNPGRIRVINQSQAMSELRLVQNVLISNQDNPKQLTTMLGLPENASRKEIFTALVKRADQVFESSPAIREAKQRYADVSAKLEKQDILHVITTGNERELVAELDKLGVPYDEDFTQSLLATPHKISVAASTGGAKNQERIASFSTPRLR